MEALTPWHLMLILLAAILLFGYKKLPEASRSLGRSLRIFKGELHAMTGDERSRSSPDAVADAAPAGAGADNGPAAVPPVPAPAVSSPEALELEAEAADVLAARLRDQAAQHVSRGAGG